jgi:hypothetical protein
VLPQVAGDSRHSVLGFANPRILNLPLESVPRSGETEEPWRRIKSKSPLTWPNPLAFHIYKEQKINSYWPSNGPVYCCCYFCLLQPVVEVCVCVCVCVCVLFAKCL